jgi:hypothetical protein
MRFSSDGGVEVDVRRFAESGRAAEILLGGPAAATGPTLFFIPRVVVQRSSRSDAWFAQRPLLDISTFLFSGDRCDARR